MGLDCSHNAWHGAYSAFMRWREELAKVAGLPPLALMEGFYTPMRADGGGIPTFYLGIRPDDLVVNGIRRLEESLPIKWDCLQPSALHELLYHSDCEGEIEADRCGPIADALEELLPKLHGDRGGHIGDIHAKTQQFINGLRAAAAAGEPLDFH